MKLLEEFKGQVLKNFEGIVGVDREYLRRLSDLRTREICKCEWKICKVCWRYVGCTFDISNVIWTMGYLARYSTILCSNFRSLTDHVSTWNTLPDDFLKYSFLAEFEKARAFASRSIQVAGNDAMSLIKPNYSAIIRNINVLRLANHSKSQLYDVVYIWH